MVNMIWMNHNDLTSLYVSGMMVNVRGIIPKWATSSSHFGLVNYYHSASNVCKYGKIYIYQCSLYFYLSMYTRMIYICMVYLYRQDFSDPAVTSARVASDRSLRLSSIQLVCVKHRVYAVNDVSQFVVRYHPVGG